MADEFPTVAALVRYIHERSDEIEKAFLIPPGSAFIDQDVQVLEPSDVFTLYLRAKTGDAIVVRDFDAEAVLNNGILQRRSIKLFFPRSEEDSLVVAEVLEG